MARLRPAAAGLWYFSKTMLEGRAKALAAAASRSFGFCVSNAKLL